MDSIFQAKYFQFKSKHFNRKLATKILSVYFVIADILVLRNMFHKPCRLSDQNKIKKSNATVIGLIFHCRFALMHKL